MGNVQDSIAGGRTRKNLRKPSRLTTNMIVAYSLPVIKEAILSIYREAESQNQFEIQDVEGCQMEEMNSLYKNNIWKLTELPKVKKAIRCKWAFKKKQESLDSDIVRYKARLVVKIYAQREGIYYNEVFSLVVKHSSIQILLALVTQ